MFVPMSWLRFRKPRLRNRSVLVITLVCGLSSAIHAAPLTIDSGNQDYHVTSNETVDEIRVGNMTDENRIYVQNGATLTWMSTRLI